MDSELICPLCEEEYSEESPPRLLTGCGHSYCEGCLKKIMTEKKGSFKIVCPEDGEMVTMKDSTMNHFPKNIALLKIIESKKSNSSFKNSSLEFSKIAKHEEEQQDEDDRDLVDAIISSKNATNSIDNISAEELNDNDELGSPVEMCFLHRKPLQVVCIMDLMKICASCAIFGEHKGHEFKSMEEIESERIDYYTSIIGIMDKKEEISTRISNQETCSSIMEILENKKETMRKKITEKYRKLIEIIENKQNQSLRNLNSVIHKTESKLKNLMKIDPHIIEKYDTWEEKSYNQIKILEGEDFQKKLQLLFCDGNEAETEDVVEEGDLIIAEMNKQEENLINEVETALQNIGVDFNQQIFSHVDGFVQIFDEAKKKKSKRVSIGSTVKADQTPPPSSAKNMKKEQTPPILPGKVEKQNESMINMNTKILNDVTHYTSSPTDHEMSMNLVSNVVQAHTEESLLEQEEEVMVKKPEWVKHESPPSSKIEEVVMPQLEIKNEKKVETKTFDKKRSPAGTERSNKKDMSFEKVERPNKKKLSKIKVSEKYEKIIDALVHDQLEILDLTNAQLGDAHILAISEFLNGSKVKTVKFIRNKLNDETISKMLPFLGGIITLNLSQNFHTDHALDVLIEGKGYLCSMKNIILSQNKIIERKHKLKIDKLRSLGFTVSV